MSNLTPEQLKERYEKMPEDVKEAYFGVETSEILQKIGKENNLPIIKIGLMADEAGLLMLGLTRPNEFISNLANRMEIDKELAKRIGQAINERIFSKIRESLRKIHTPPPSKSDFDGKNIFEERNKDQVFHSKTEVVDPYREPIG